MTCDLPSPEPVEPVVPTVPETPLTVEIGPEASPPPQTETPKGEASGISKPVWEAERPGTSCTGSWIQGINNVRPVEDVLAKFAALEGELTDEDARATLAEFLYHNPRFLMDFIGGIKMFPMQELILKGWAANDYNLMVAGRGLGKSFLAALFALYWAIFNPNARIVIASFSFRQSRAILDLCVKLINEEGATLLRSCFPNDMRRGTDEYRLEVPNGAVIRCLPLGDGKKIRGVRADVLVIDEYAFLPEAIIGEILQPFLASNGKIREQRAINEREDELIKQGRMTEAQRTVLEDRKKVVFMSSASWQFEHLYKRYREWVGLVTLDAKLHPGKAAQFKESGLAYFIARLGWEAAPEGLLNVKTITAAKSENSEAMFNREYGAIFTADSDGMFRASRMEACTVKEGETPTLELRGEKQAEYVVGIDQNASGSEESDHFAICVMKIVTRETDKRRIGMVVHQYAVAGCGFTDHALYLHYILNNFNVVYVAVDASQGSELEFVNFCNQLPAFGGLQLLPVHGVDFNRTDFAQMLPDIKRGYNLTARQIVQKQRFSSEWQRPANEYLTACFDHRNILFAGKIAANDGAAGVAMNVDISALYAHEHFKAQKGEDGKGMTISDFINHQDFLVDLTKKECAMIRPKVSDLGTISYTLPQNLKRTTGANRVRKDSYSALLVANWAVKTYVEMTQLQIQTGPRDFSYGWAA